ncbi:UNVERIFIED_CONTAM: Retrovirus-related Pol polyprotein from transposon TNT 1-94 [Sesamum indicum]
MLGLTQSSYIEKVLKRFKMKNSKRGFLPMRHGIKMSKKQSPKIGEELKRISDIPYASACTRPDVAYALSVTSRYQAYAEEAHWSAWWSTKDIARMVSSKKRIRPLSKHDRGISYALGDAFTL